jgi:hypothetical protein
MQAAEETEDDNDQLAELERQWRQKLDVDNYKKAALSDEEMRIAEKLVGRDNAERRKNWRGDRPLRLKPVLIHYETHWIPGDRYLGGRMAITRIENGRATDHKWQEDDFDAEVDRLRKAGFTVRHVITEREKFEAAQTKRRLDSPPQQQPRQPQDRHSGRRFILDRLKGFRL